MSDQAVRWKLMFRGDDIKPDCLMICSVMSAHVFRPDWLLIANPHFFKIEQLKIGKFDQLWAPLPAHVIADQFLRLDTAQKDLWCEIYVRNMSDQPRSFAAELQGFIIVINKADAVANDWEGPVTF